MGMNPDTNEFEQLQAKVSAAHADDRGIRDTLAKACEESDHAIAVRKAFSEASKVADEAKAGQLVRPNGEPVPKHWAIFQVGEEVVIKEYTFRVAYIGKSNILFEPAGLPVLGSGTATSCPSKSRIGLPCKGEERPECDGCDRRRGSTL